VADQQNEGFVRQRRNLMIVSLVLLFSEATDLKVEKISAFGTELLVGQPQAVTMALWIAAIYWLIRFYQYSNAGYKGVLNNAVQHHVEKYEVCEPVALKRLLHEEPNLLDPISGIKATSTFECIQFGIHNSKPNYFEVLLGLKKVATDGTGGIDQRLDPKIVRIDGTDLFWLRVRAWIHLILHTTLFTELVLPYIVFALPVLYVGYKLIR